MLLSLVPYLASVIVYFGIYRDVFDVNRKERRAANWRWSLVRPLLVSTLTPLVLLGADDVEDRARPWLAGSAAIGVLLTVIAFTAAANSYDLLLLKVNVRRWVLNVQRHRFILLGGWIVIAFSASVNVWAASL
jgi:hypothetical protein